ncbi:MAG: ACP S-malonyltransferase [Thermodesulfobacteriota bacterium]|nr:ACP S-malonyltransferase [Thermodesulfobacteriota bacterium]
MGGKIAFLFPGQGSQSIGMGHDIMLEFPEVKGIFEQVDEICRKPISRLCFEGPLDELTLTANLQPAITAVNLACLTALNQSGIKPGISAGHSLGEFSALASAGVISGYDALRLVKSRGELMHRESLENPGVMAAVLKMDIHAVGKIVIQAGEKGIISIANHNTAEQIVITGEKGPISYAIDLVESNGGKAIPLKVSGAWHCSLMKNAVDEFREFMEEISFSWPETGILLNATAENESDPKKIKDIMAQQLINPVKWYDIILKMIEDKVDVFVEVGPKKVLSGLLKKIIPRKTEVKVYNVEDMKSLELFLEKIT